MTLALRDDLAEPRPLDTEWAVLAVTACGLCGSDLSAALAESSPMLLPFNSFPAVIGHEILARVAQAPRGGDFREGDRVAVDPFLGCSARAEPQACRSCARGEHCLCERAAIGHLAPGWLLGFHRQLPGGSAERIVAHRAQLVKVPDGIPDDVATLAEPLSVAVHALLRHLPRGGERVLVIGGGPIAFLTLFALRALAPGARVTLLTLGRFSAEQALLLGAHAAIAESDPSARDAAVERDVPGARALRTVFGRAPVIGGYDVVYDCVGSATSFGDALAYARGGGAVVMVGAAGQLPRIDLTPLWSKEITIVGTLGYSRERPPDGTAHQWPVGEDGRIRTFDIALALLADDPSRARRIITHRFPLDRWRDAFIANLRRERSQAIKTLLLHEPA